jgi:hypothetical protein
MKTRRFIAPAVAVGVLCAALQPQQAAAIPAPALPAAAAAGAGAAVVGGLIGAVGVICIVDFFMKLNGQKNWDGSPRGALRGR